MDFQLYSSKLSRFALKFICLFSIFLTALSKITAQTPQSKVPSAPPQTEDNTWWYVMLIVLFAALAGALALMVKNRRDAKAALNELDKEDSMNDEYGWDANSVDADREMEWFRRHKKSVGKLPKKNNKKNLAQNLPQTSKVLKRNSVDDKDMEFSEKEFKKKLQTLQFNQLPIFKFHKLELARPFAPLALSSDDALLSAIEQTQDEFEEDEEIRDLAVRILTRFKTRNSVEALSQVALYDISSNLRSKAVTILADFDHESVFETILLCCADPTREVRAAAARGLFRLSFDRADAWTRIAETADDFRMKQAALAAKEADLVKRSLDRLIHQDQKIAYEAIALIALMIRAGEIKEILKAVENHPEKNVKLALLHVIGLTKEESTLENLYELLEKDDLTKELKEKIEQVIQSFELVPA